MRDATGDRGARGHGQGYKYAHDFPGHFVDQDYMPEGKKFYQPSDQGFEKDIAARLRGLWPGRYEKGSEE